MTTAETKLGVTSKVTVERREQIVLIGINRPLFRIGSILKLPRAGQGVLPVRS